MKKKLTFLLALLMIAVTSAWADTAVLSTPSEAVATLSDANGIVTITDASGNTGIQAGSGSFTIGGSSVTPMKLSSKRQFNLTYAAGATISKVTLYVTSNKSDEGQTIGTSSSDRTSLGTLPVKGGTPLEIDITSVEGLNASEQFLAVIVVEYSTTAPSFKASPTELTFALNPNLTTKTQTFTLTGQNLTDGTYDLTVPTVEGLTVTPTSFAVAEGKVNQEVSVTYASTADVAKANTAITATVNEIPVSVAITYQSRSKANTQSTVSKEATWDWSKLAETVELTDASTPKKTDEFLLADLDDRIIFVDAFGDPTAIKMEGMQFPSRGGYAQGTTIKFKTSVPGTIDVDFNNTGGDGSGDRPDRYLNVNGKNTEFKSNSSTKVSATGIAVPAGDVVLMGNMVDAEADGGFTPNMLRWHKITFTPAKPVDIEISPAEGDIAAALAAAKEGVAKVGNITINLAKDGNYTASAPIVVNSGLTLKGDNSTIDVTGLDKDFIQWNSEPVVEAVESGQYVITDPILIEGVNIKGLTKAVIGDNGKAYAFDKFTINKCIFAWETQAGWGIGLTASMPISLTVSNSTMYSKTAGSNNFFALNGSKRPWEITGYTDLSEATFTFANNTFYNLAKSKQFINTNRLKGQAKQKFVMNSNIFVDCSNKKIYGNMTNNQKQIVPDGKNTYFFDGAAFAETNYNGDEGLKTNPTFANVETPDFTVNVGSQQAKEQTGDIIHWPVTYDATKAMAVDVTISPAEGDIATALIAAENGVDKVGNITINLAKDGNYTASAPIVVNSGLTLKGDNSTIDVTGLDKDFIQWNSEPVVEAVESGQYVITDPILIEGVNIKGLTKAVIGDNGKAYAFDKFTINKCIFAWETQAGWGIGLTASMPISLTVSNSTMYSKTAGSNNFFALNGSKRPWEITGYTDLSEATFTFANNTFYNLAKSKQFINTNRLKGQAKQKFVMNSNIFVDCSNKKIYGNMTNNQKQIVPDGKNTYFFDGAAFAETNYNGDEGLKTNPGFDAEKVVAGDFTIGASTAQAKFETGDPRWVVTYVAPVVDKTALETEITAATTLLGETAVDADPGKALSDAITAATTVKETGEFQEDIDAAVVALQAAEKAFAKAQLTAEITTATTLLGEAATDADPGKALKDAIDAATTVKDNAESTVTQLTDAVTALKAAEEAFKTATGINGITVDGAANDIFSDGKPVYNLSGQRVFKGYKGVVIKNGRKIVVK